MHYIEKLYGATGWRRNAALFALGALGTLLFAPFDLWPLLFVCVPLYFLMLDAAPTRRRAAFDGFWFGYGYFMAGTYWIAISMTVEMERFAWMIPFSVLGLSAVLALYFLLLGLIYYSIKGRALLGNLCLFVALWSSMEWLRSVGMFGFPWNALGYALVEIPPLLQMASAVGIYGMNILAVAIGLSVVPIIMREARAAYFSIGTVLAVAVAFGYGIYQLHGVTPVPDRAPRMRVVQGNITQTMKWDAEQQTEIMRIYRGLSHIETEGPKPDIVIWPETALPFAIDPRGYGFGDLLDMIPHGASLVTGVVRAEGDYLTNALMALDKDGEAAFYDKRQLVPFGEFIPLRSILPLERIAPGPRDFDRGKDLQPLVFTQTIPTLQSMVCYESIFPWAAAHGERPRWLVTVTNDAWFGRSIGPYQHLAMGRVRAVEQGLPLVRAANTGVSAVIDRNGIILKRLNLNSRGIIDIALPLAGPKTIYAQLGNILSISMLLTIYLLAWRYRGST